MTFVAVTLVLSVLLVFKTMESGAEDKINIKCGKNEEFTADEVMKHNKTNDLWLSYDFKVFNMTEFYPDHPGGAAMLRKAGKDASDVLHKVPAHFTALKFIENKMSELCIGKLKV